MARRYFQPLAGFVDRLLGADSTVCDGLTADSFRAWLRHDLRTPINAVQG